MNKSIFIGMMVVGAGLIIFGISAADSFESDVSRFFTGSPTDKSMWLMIGGAAVSAAGAFGFFFGSSRA